MTIQGLSPSYPNFKPTAPKPNHSGLLFGASPSTDSKDTMSTSKKSAEELEKERIRQLAEGKVNSRYNAAQLKEMGKTQPAPRQTLIDEAIQKLKDDLANNNGLDDLSADEKQAVTEDLKLMESSNEAHYKIYENILSQLRKVEGSGVKLSHAKKRALALTPKAAKEADTLKEQLIRNEIKKIEQSEAPGWISQKAHHFTDAIHQRVKNGYYAVKDAYHGTFNSTAYAAKRGFRHGQDVAAVGGSGYLGLQAGNWLSAPYSLIPTILTTAAAPLLGDSQKNSITLGAGMYGLSQAFLSGANNSFYGVPVGHLARGASTVVAASGFASKESLAKAGSAASYTAGVAAYPFNKLYSAISNMRKPAAISAEAQSDLQSAPTPKTVSPKEKEEDKVPLASPLLAEEKPKPDITKAAKKSWIPSMPGFSLRSKKAEPVAMEDKAEADTPKPATPITTTEPTKAPIVQQPAPQTEVKPVEATQETVEIEKIVPDDTPTDTKKPETKNQPQAQKSAMEKYGWPVFHVAGGSSLIAGGALLHLPVITAPIGMGMMAVGTGWAGYGVIKAWQASLIPTKK